MRTKEYWKRWAAAAAVRAVKTFTQSFIAMLPTTAATLGSVDWQMAASTAALAAVISLGTSFAGLPEVPVPEDR